MQRRRCNLPSQGEHLISQISLLPRHYLNRISVISLMTSKNVSCDTSAIVSLPSMILSSLLSLINSLSRNKYVRTCRVYRRACGWVCSLWTFEWLAPAGQNQTILSERSFCFHIPVGKRKKRHPICIALAVCAPAPVKLISRCMSGLVWSYPGTHLINMTFWHCQQVPVLAADSGCAADGILYSRIC